MIKAPVVIPNPLVTKRVKWLLHLARLPFRSTRYGNERYYIDEEGRSHYGAHRHFLRWCLGWLYCRGYIFLFGDQQFLRYLWEFRGDSYSFWQALHLVKPEHGGDDKGKCSQKALLRKFFNHLTLDQSEFNTEILYEIVRYGMVSEEEMFNKFPENKKFDLAEQFFVISKNRGLFVKYCGNGDKDASAEDFHYARLALNFATSALQVQRIYDGVRLWMPSSAPSWFIAMVNEFLEQCRLEIKKLKFEGYTLTDKAIVSPYVQRHAYQYGI